MDIAKRLQAFAKINPKWEIFIWLDHAVGNEEMETLTKTEGGRITTKSIPEEMSSFRSLNLLRRLNSSDASDIGHCSHMSDVLRLEVTYHYGGIYFDTDTVPTLPLDEYGSLFRWPFVAHKVCGINIASGVFGMDRHSAFLDFALNASIELCMTFDACGPPVAGPPLVAMAFLRYNSSDIAMIPQQYWESQHPDGVASHLYENSWR
jgi:hypothetical protein